MDNKNIQDKISALLKEYNYVECKNALGETIKAKYILQEYGELFVVESVSDLEFELVMPINEVVSVVGINRR